MQQVAPLHALRRFRSSFTIAGILGVLAALAALLGLWLNTPRVSEPAAVIPVVAPARARIFADEAAYVPSAAEYAEQTDEYLSSVATARTTSLASAPSSRAFRDELAGAGAAYVSFGDFATVIAETPAQREGPR